MVRGVFGEYILQFSNLSLVDGDRFPDVAESKIERINIISGCIDESRDVANHIVGRKSDCSMKPVYSTPFPLWRAFLDKGARPFGEIFGHHDPILRLEAEREERIIRHIVGPPGDS